MIIRYSDGSYVEGVIHRLETGMLRASVRGVDDAVEYRLILDGWTSEIGDVVTFEFTNDREVGIFLGRSGDEEGRCAAGGDCVLRRVSLSGRVH